MVTTGEQEPKPTVLVHGTGSIGMRHVRVLEQHVGATALALPVRKERTLADGEKLELVDSLAAAAERGAIAAIIATATGRHLDDAAAALRAGLHVLVEKPVAASAAGIAVLEQLAREHQRHIYVGCCLRFQRALQQFRALLHDIGNIHHVRIECQSYLPSWRPGTDYRTCYSARADEGGVLRDLIHEIDYAAWLFGWPSEVSARIGNTGVLGIEAEEWAELTWQAPRAPAVSIHLDYLTRPSRRIMRAQGERGTLELDLLAQRVLLELFGDAKPVGRTSEVAYTPTIEPQDRDDVLAAQATAFLAAIAGGNAGVLATLDDGARALAICDAARSSSQTGAGVAVRDWRTA